VAKKAGKSKKKNYQFLEMLPSRADHALRVRVQHLVLQRQVEFRILPEGAPPPIKELFFQELHELTNLDHPSFFPILERGMIRGSHCFTVPLRFHSSLTMELEEGTFRVEERCQALRCLASALCAGHIQNILFGALNPDLIAWDPIANGAYFIHHRKNKLVENPLRESSFPKDIASEKAPTPTGDVYHWGLLAYWVLTRGRLPSQGNVPILELVPNLERRFAATIMTCLASKAADRPRDGAELNTLLQLDPKNLIPENAEDEDGQVVSLAADLSLSEVGVVLTEKLRQLRNTGRIPVAQPLPTPDPESKPDHSLPEGLRSGLAYGVEQTPPEMGAAPSPEDRILEESGDLAKDSQLNHFLEDLQGQEDSELEESTEKLPRSRRPMPSGALQVACAPPRLPRPPPSNTNESEGESHPPPNLWRESGGPPPC
jgi:hypothetical protein